MAKFCGKIGYTETTETTPGVWVDVITEREMYGDTLDNARRLEKSESTNDNVVVSNQISVLADPYALQHFHHIRYAKYMGTAWTVTMVRVQYPRLILTLGGEYNV